MDLHEYQAKQLLAQRGAAAPPGGCCDSPEEARRIAEKLIAQGARSIVVKAQIHSGGRGKGIFKDGSHGGVRLCGTVQEVFNNARSMLGNVLVTRQTGPAGRLVSRLLVELAPDIQKELYVAVLLDRGSSCPVLVASAEGGMDIEEVAVRTPDRIIKELIDPCLGLMPFQARRVAAGVGLKGDLIAQGTKFLLAAYKTWWECDASLVEVNPLAVVRTGEANSGLMALDAKMSLDDNALFRHADLQAMRDVGEEAPLEVEAGKFGLNYIKLDGTIACLVNGAGLAMATMDIIQHFGGRPANFLDVGGGASREQVAAAFKIILRDANVKGILVNIFGGIMDCNVIATGIVAAVKEIGLQLPLVVRLEGNNVQAGKLTLQNSGLTILSGSSMADAAQKVVLSVTG